MQNSANPHVFQVITITQYMIYVQWIYMISNYSLSSSSGGIRQYRSSESDRTQQRRT